jgi:hypothetical protein
MMFFDYDQNCQIETHYQNCVTTKFSNFGSTCIMTGDVLQRQNGYSYEVKGQDAKAGVADTTWT